MWQGRDLCGPALAGLFWGLPHWASTHNKAPQCLVDPEALAQAQCSHGRDAVVAATERYVLCYLLRSCAEPDCPRVPAGTAGASTG